MKTYELTYWDNESNKIRTVVDAYGPNQARGIALVDFRARNEQPRIYISCVEIKTRMSATLKHAANIANLIDQLRDDPSWMALFHIAEELHRKVKHPELVFEVEALIENADRAHVDNIISLYEQGAV